MDEAQKDLERALDQFAPEIATAGRALLEQFRKRLPGATILVYDNYNALVIVFAAAARASTAILSIAIYPRWINLFFARGTNLADPDGMLKGEGRQVRHLPKVSVDCLEDPRIEALVAQAVANADPPIDGGCRGALVMKSISPTRRPRSAV